MRTRSPFCLPLLLRSLLPLCVLLSLFLSFCFISTTSMKNHIHSKLRICIILFIVSFNLASLCRGEEMQLNETTKLHPLTDALISQQDHTEKRTATSDRKLNQYIAMRQWPHVLHGKQTLKSKNHLPLCWTDFPHWSTADVPLTLTLCRRDFGMWCSFPSRKRSVYHQASPFVAETPVRNSLSETLLISFSLLYGPVKS